MGVKVGMLFNHAEGSKMDGRGDLPAQGVVPSQHSRSLVPREHKEVVQPARKVPVGELGLHKEKDGLQVGRCLFLAFLWVPVVHEDAVVVDAGGRMGDQEEICLRGICGYPKIGGKEVWEKLFRVVHGSP